MVGPIVLPSVVDKSCEMCCLLAVLAVSSGVFCSRCDDILGRTRDLAAFNKKRHDVQGNFWIHASFAQWHLVRTCRTPGIDIRRLDLLGGL